WCARSAGGAIVAEGFTPADEDGLARLVLQLGTDVKACVEMMSGAVWVRDRLRAAGWQVEGADARRVKGIAPPWLRDRPCRRARACRALPARSRARALDPVARTARAAGSGCAAARTSCGCAPRRSPASTAWEPSGASD